MSAGSKRALRGAKVWSRAGLISGVALFAFCPAALAAKASTGAYVVDSGDSIIVQYNVLSNGTLIPDNPATVATGNHPTSLALSADEKSAYVSNLFQSNISQYDVAANGTLTPKTPATVNTCGNPQQVAASQDNKSVYVFCQDSSRSTPTGPFSPNHIYQYNAAADGTLSPKTPATVNVNVGQPEGLVVSPDGKNMYALSGRDPSSSSFAAPGSVTEFKVAANGTLRRNSPATIATGPVPTGIAVNPNGKTAYVVNSDLGFYDGGTGSISQYAIGASGTLTPDVPATVATGTGIYDPNSFPDFIAMSPTGTTALIVTGGAAPEGRLRFNIAANGTLSPNPASLTAPTFQLDALTPVAPAYNADGVHGYITDEGGPFVAGSGYNVGSNGPPVVELYKDMGSANPTQNAPSEVLTHQPFEGNPFPFQIVLNNQPAFQGTTF